MITILLSLSALAIWWTPVYIGYRRGMRGMPVFVASRTLIAVGITLMYCLPTVYFTINSDIYLYPLMFYEYYPHALCMVNLTGLGFLLTTALYTGKYRQRANRDAVLSARKRRKLIFIFALLCFAGALARLHDFRTGSLFFYDRSYYQFEYYHLFVLFDVAKELMIASGYFFYALGHMQKRRIYRLVGVSIWLSQIIFAAFIGSKFLMITLIFQAAVLMALLGWRPRIGQLAFLFAGTVFVVGLMLFYNLVVRAYISSEYELLTPGKTAKVYREAFSEMKLQEHGLLTHIMARLLYTRQIAAVYSAVPDVIPYQNGYTYRHFLYFLVPRPIWPQKPDMREASAFMEIAIPSEIGGSEPLPMIAEAYLNFSWPGTFLIGVFVALFSLWIDYRLVPLFCSNNLIWKTLWALSSIYFVWNSQTFSRYVTNFLKLLIIFIFIDMLSRSILKYPLYRSFRNRP